MAVLATVSSIGEPGNHDMGITSLAAGLGGRTCGLGFNPCSATAIGIGEPGIQSVGINDLMAGLGGRKAQLGFMRKLATAI